MQPFDFSSVFAAAPNPYLLLSAEEPYTILGANEAYLTATLTTREQLVGRAMFDAFPDNPADPAATGVRNLRTSLEHVVSRREPHIMAVQKYDIRRPDGTFEERYWSPKNSPVLRDDGTVASIIHWVEDVTELVRANVLAVERARQAVELQGHYDRREAAITLREEELTERLLVHHERERLSEERRRAEARTREILESITDAFLAVDAEWRFTYFNPQAEKVLGRPAGEMLGKVIWEEYPGLAGGEFERMYRRVVAEGVAGSTTAFYPDHKRWYEIRAYPGVGGGLSIYFRDVTERVTAEEALRASERRLRRFFESDMVGTIYWDLDGRISDANDRFLKIVGYERADLAGGSVRWADMTPPEYRHLDDRSVAEFKETGVCTPYEKEYIRKDGSRVPVIVGGAMLDDRRHEGVGFALDITERKFAEAEREARLEAEQAARAEAKQAAEVLRENQETLRFALDTAGLGDWDLDLVTGKAKTSFRHDQCFGATKPIVDWSYEKFLKYVHPDDRAEEDRKFRASVASGEDWSINCRVVWPDGSVHWIESSGMNYRHVDGKATRMLGMVRDVTERRRADDALRASEERLRLATNAAGLGIWVWQIAADDVVWENDRMYEILGVPRTTKPVNAARFRAEYVHPDDAAEFDRVIGNALRSGDRFFFQGRFRRGDGEVRWVEFGGVPKIAADGTPISILGTAADITERKGVEEVLRESEERFRLLAEALPQMVWTAQPDGTVEYFNRKWYQYTGNTKGTEGDASWVPAFDEQTGERVHEAWYRAVRTGEPYELEYPLRRAADGMDRWHLARALPLRDAAGRVVRWFGAITDIHDQKEAQARIEQLLGSERAARDEAERAGRMKDEFLATLSHELRTPLNAILGWAQILSSGSRDEEDLSEGLRTIERNARAQTQIIEDLLDMSRIISGKVRLDVQRVDFANVVKEAVATAKPSADAKGIRLNVVLDPHAGPVSGDPGRLQQVMWNLLSNAVKFTPRGGRVQVVLERVNSHVEVSVIDTGEGIKADFLPHVFDRFRQADATTTRRHGGLGLGLSIVKQLVEMHGGSVRVKSPGEGGGTTFAVSLPLTAVHPEPDPGVARYHPRASGSNKGLGGGLDGECPQISGVKVLVVDDEPDARALVKRLLEDCQAQVLTAGSAEEAVHLVQAERPQVMVCDIGMPGEDGYSLIRRLRALPPEHGGQVPAAALTAYARAEDRVKAVLAGFQMHLAKPVEPAELIATVAALARRTGIGGL